ncbi:DNA helicase RecQ [Haliscomenobacter hydrossis]|uniref:DNA helicase RecQ n=1 Tax=Haliscomenobacter hydrossis (strain ATCC 27775 / DSM 1100 / LMG 10767 / O) TaxID=760192 RepID=F4L206_HALH1|nr:DNA helicase RecQ [Haliscomenobacter hydrossis]AEE50639.1 ATP-dependent DNA helicase RecQ [Haliscomenobacter hydrossis DSM 1100]
MTVTQETLQEALQKYFGFDAFKGNQEAIIQNLLNRDDTFVIMPTGGGKSLCYQLPALMLEGTAIVISPLIALMKNQVDSIRGYSQSDDVAHFLNSSLTKAQMKLVKQAINDGNTKLLYIAPETLTKDENIEFFRTVNVSFVAVDEAHCISEWGHDFRPEYRRIRSMLDGIGQEVPIIALTATATPKVQSDILKNLGLRSEHAFMSSFNRENLYYEVRPKGKPEQAVRQIIQVIKGMPGQSGIIYVQSRKAAEEIAKVLQVNDIKAAPYHAGLDAKTRTRTQDEFLMEDVDVIVATIAFGMGIDKPDVRFVIHFDMPKSIENYYQETGRAGRDGLEGRCIAFYAYKDMLKLEKFLRDKPVAEREMGSQLMQEVMAYAETTACRRQFLLHYFGEEYDQANCTLCDNCRYPKEKIEVTKEMQDALKVVDELDENFTIKTLLDFVQGAETKEIKDYAFNKKPSYGVGKGKDINFWESVYRHALLQDLLYKDVESYGLLKLTEKGRDFLKKTYPVQIPLNHDYEKEQIDANNEDIGRTAVLDETLVGLLKDLRRREAKRHNVPPYVIFQDPSLEDMATQYPISMDDMVHISGVSRGKAIRYGKAFVEMIKKYVEENEIDRPTDFVVKQVANKSKIKVNIIQSIDRKVPLEDIAEANDITMDEILEELYAIVLSGTKVNIDYYLDETMDEAIRDDIYDYFMSVDTDDAKVAYKALKDDDITMDEILMVRIKFLSELAN